MLRLKLGFLTLSLASFASQAASLVSGPMAGPAAMREAVVWLQADGAAKARLDYQAIGTADTRSVETALEKREDYATALQLTDLQPGTEYRYRLYLDGQAAGPQHSLKTQANWPWHTDPPAFTTLLGSCAYFNDPAYDRPGKPYGDGGEIFDAMAALQPDLTLWLGDNLYFREADNSPWGMADRYRRTRALPELQKLLQTGQHAAIWDDHDYGPNDANASFIYKDTALQLFKRYWPNPTFGMPDAPGVFSIVSFGDVDFFLLDDRWNRDADESPRADKHMFGPAQMRWLENALKHSTATFKVIAAGSQLFNNYNSYEGWNHFGAEQKSFKEWLDQAGINGVLFLSGDRHHTEMLKIERPGTYPLYELTCSPLTAGTHAVAEEAKKPNLVSGTLVGQRNFCRLGFSGKRGARVMEISSLDSQGKLLWKHSLTAENLSKPKPARP